MKTIFLALIFTAPFALAADSSELNFENVKLRVFQPYCNQCHSFANGNSGNVNLETYASVQYSLDDIEKDIETDSMPKGLPALPPDAKSLLMAWIAAGAPEISCTSRNPLKSSATEDLVRELESRGWTVTLKQK